MKRCQTSNQSPKLIGIRSLVSPRLLQALASAGWKDDIAIVDSTFPAESLVSNGKVIRLDEMPSTPLVREIMNLWQLDRDHPMAVMVGDNDKVSNIVSSLVHLIVEAERESGHDMEGQQAVLLKEEEFKNRASLCKHIVVTGEPGPWNSIIIRLIEIRIMK